MGESTFSINGKTSILPYQPTKKPKPFQSIEKVSTQYRVSDDLYSKQILLYLYHTIHPLLQGCTIFEQYYYERKVSFLAFISFMKMQALFYNLELNWIDKTT